MKLVKKTEATVRGFRNGLRTAKNAAFTLLEVMIAVTVIAALVAISAQAINGSIERSQTTAREALLQNIGTAKQRYIADQAATGTAVANNAALNLTQLGNYLTQRGAAPANEAALLRGTGATSLTWGTATTAASIP